jgi:hypothetical protein
MQRSPLIFLITTLILSACSFPEAKEPEFQSDEDVVVEKLKSLRSFENARIKWSSRTFERRTIDVLVVELVNGQAMIDDETELRELGKEAMNIALAAIENESEYERLEVIFIKESRRGVLVNTFTRSFQYAPEDLK